MAQLPSYMVKRAIREQTLVRLLADFDAPALPIHLIYLRENRHQQRLKTLVDFLLHASEQAKMGQASLVPAL